MIAALLRTREEWVAGLRRGAWAFALGVVLLLVAIPAVADLHALLRTVGIALLVLGAVIVLATVYLRDQRSAG